MTEFHIRLGNGRRKTMCLVRAAIVLAELLVLRCGSLLRWREVNAAKVCVVGTENDVVFGYFRDADAIGVKFAAVLAARLVNFSCNSLFR